MPLREVLEQHKIYHPVKKRTREKSRSLKSVHLEHRAIIQDVRDQAETPKPTVEKSQFKIKAVFPIDKYAGRFTPQARKRELGRTVP